MKLTQTHIWLGAGVLSLTSVGLFSLSRPSTPESAEVAPTTMQASVGDTDAQELAPEAPEASALKSEKPMRKTKVRTADNIDEKSIRYVMVKKQCKGVCTESPVYRNARVNADEFIRNIPNGRKVVIGKVLGDWAHVTVFNADNTELTDVSGWTYKIWLVTD